MSIFDVLTMIGGLCLFLFGMDLMASRWSAAPAARCGRCWTG